MPDTKNTRESEFRKRLLSTFKIEAREHLKTISAGLVELEKAPSAEAQRELVETIYRATHSLKGASRAVSLSDIESICQSIEGLFSGLKRGEAALSQELLDLFYSAIELINTIVAIEPGQPGIEKSRLLKLLEGIAALEKKELLPEDKKTAHILTNNRSAAPSAASADSKELSFRQTYFSDTVRISTSKLGKLLLQAEEMLTVKLASNQHLDNLKDITARIQFLRNEFTKAYLELMPSRNADVRDRRQIHNTQSAKLQDFFNSTLNNIKSIENTLFALSKSSRIHNKSLDRMVDGLLDDTKQAMMLPFSSLLESFPILIRDISHSQGKEADLIIHGDSIEVDRRILEEMKDALIHLVRNSVDHGIERPEVRLVNGKPRRGVININITPVEGNKIELIISDDGCGVDISRVKDAAVRNSIISTSEAESMTDQEALHLIFHSGVSTSPIITDISGRGLGLAIVREKAEKLGGSVSAETGLNGWTRFRIILPLTVATFRGVLVRAADQLFIIPTTNVERTLRVRKNDIITVENKETIPLNGSPVSFASLDKTLELNPKKALMPSDSVFVVVLSAADKKIAFGTDEIVNEQEVLVKSIGKQLSRVRNISGAAILGSGKPVPILNVNDLIRSAIKMPSSASMPAPVITEAEGEKKSVLVAEDSITSRMLLKNILESAGYNVKTAVDGIDAITALKTEKFDIVISDVEMPRMDGFDLTARIRSDKNISEVPIVLVTALETREDRERGINVGANAYIVKSDFSQSNLLEVIKRLI